jgi:hypothetical protein
MFPTSIDTRLTNDAPDAVTTKNPYGMLPLRTAIRSKASTEVIDALIRAAPEVVQQFGVSGKTCLHLACLYSMDFDLFHELLTLWPDATKWKDRDGWYVISSSLLVSMRFTVTVPLFIIYQASTPPRLPLSLPLDNRLDRTKRIPRSRGNSR